MRIRMSACMKLDRCWAVLLDPAMTSAVAERVGQGLLRSVRLLRSLRPGKLRRRREVAKINEDAPELLSTTRKTREVRRIDRKKGEHTNCPDNMSLEVIVFSA
jgi:hypothetical protein